MMLSPVANTLREFMSNERLRHSGSQDIDSITGVQFGEF